jgi:hypothetical protein
MIVQHSGIVKEIKKHPTDLWCVTVKRTETKTSGDTTYIGIPIKPRLKEGQKVFAGDEI